MPDKLSFIIPVIAVNVLVACATAQQQPRTIYTLNIEPRYGNLQPARQLPHLRVATLNIAHGRKDSLNQLLVTENTFKKNLDDIATILNIHRPHVVALQEADAASRWSGSFDHVAYIAAAAEYPWQAHAHNATSWLYTYGTALLSELPIIETIEHTFQPTPPTLNKGFVLAQIQWPYEDGKQSRKVDIISLHLDFSRLSVRQHQIDELRDVLSTRTNPAVIMGDFNSEWLTEVSVIKDLTEKSNFKAYQPESNDQDSYKNKRLDWILISRDMEFVNYRVLPDKLSDHTMIIADIRYKDSPE